MSVRELIEQLQAFPPEAEVGIKADCCNHIHPIKAVRPPTDEEFDDGPEVAIQAG